MTKSDQSHTPRRRRIGFANVVAVLALFVALGGGAYAAAQAPKNSVTSKSIKNNEVKSVDLKNNQVKSEDIKNGTVKGSDVDESSLGEVPTATFASATNLRAAFSNGANINMDGTGGNQTVESATINAPVAGKLLITGGLRPDNNNGDDIYSCDLMVDGALIAASSRGSVVSNDHGGNDDNSCETSGGAEVSAGNYTVAVRGVGIAVGNKIVDASIQVLFVPEGPS